MLNFNYIKILDKFEVSQYTKICASSNFQVIDINTYLTNSGRKLVPNTNQIIKSDLICSDRNFTKSEKEFILNVFANGKIKKYYMHGDNSGSAEYFQINYSDIDYNIYKEPDYYYFIQIKNIKSGKFIQYLIDQIEELDEFLNISSKLFKTIEPSDYIDYVYSKLNKYIDNETH